MDLGPHLTDLLEGRKAMRINTIAARLAVLATSVWALGLPSPVGAEPRLRIEYDPPRLSVDAEDTRLLDLLNAIGAKVGFTVAESRAASTPVTVAIAGASVEDVLQRLLRSENHTILYRPAAGGGEVVDRIVLLGPPGQPSGVAVAGVGPARAPVPAASDPHPPVATPSPVDPAASSSGQEAPGGQ